MPTGNHKISRKLFNLALLLALIASCTAQIPTTTTSHTTLTILAAASLTESFGEIGQQFEKEHPGVSVQFSYAGSQQLVQQLAAGAPADVFAAASPKTMQDAVNAGRIQSSAPQTFATNRLVIAVPANNPAGLKSALDLAKPGLKLVLAAKEVPAGQYALAFLDKASQQQDFGSDYKQKVLNNVVSYENNVKAVLAKVTLGEADAGIVYATDVVSAGDQITPLPIADPLNVIATYPVAVIQDSKNQQLARDFVNLLISSPGQKILAKYGFLPGQ